MPPQNRKHSQFLRALLVAAVATVCTDMHADVCTTQSAMTPNQREPLLAAANTFAALVQAGDTRAIRSQTVPEIASSFDGIAATIASTAPRLKDAAFHASTVWLLDASDPASTHDAQFFCNLNKSDAQTSFGIPALPSGRYGLAMLDTTGSATPMQIAFLLRESKPNTWLLAGFFPRATTAAGHDGLWYWTQARGSNSRRQPWVSWIQYDEAERLLKPVNFVSSTHLDQLHEERTKAAPSVLSSGVSDETPLILRAADGTEYRITAVAADDSLPNDRIDLAIHFRAEPLTDPVAARQRNHKAALAFVAAYPELRAAFHGVWVYAEPEGHAPFASEEPMDSLR